MTTILSPTYIKSLPPKDGWGNDWEFGADQASAVTAAQQYAIMSFGRDGKVRSRSRAGGRRRTSIATSSTRTARSSQYPEGVQQQ